MDGQEVVVELKSWNCKLGKWKKVGGLLIKILKGLLMKAWLEKI